MVLPRYEYPRKYADFQPGVIIEHEQRRVVTHMDNLLYARLSGHAHPFFFAYGAKHGERTPVNQFLILGVVGGLAVRATSQGAIANLGWDSVSFPDPAYVGDELRAVTEILDKRISKRDASKGIIRIRTTGVNQEDRVVSNAIRSFLVST